MTNERRESAATSYEAMAMDLETAAKHCRVAAGHFRDQEVPRGCAHGLAAYGHIVNAQKYLDEVAVLHASRARAE